MKKCIYCDNLTSDDPHFESQCCGRGMCDDCYGTLVGTDEQIQLDYFDEIEIVKKKYQDATYLCYDCSHIWARNKLAIFFIRLFNRV